MDSEDPPIETEAEVDWKDLRKMRARHATSYSMVGIEDWKKNDVLEVPPASTPFARARSVHSVSHRSISASPEKSPLKRMATLNKKLVRSITKSPENTFKRSVTIAN